MGQVEELARGKGYHSLRELGLKITPEQGEHKPAYIANKVRDLDRGKDLSWWTGTGRKYWVTLADTLGVDESELLEIVQQSRTEDERSEAQNLWVFQMFPGLRPLDLRSEKLFPGLPDELTKRGGPQFRNTWWVAHGGAGKTLLGRWLEVNFGWTVVKAQTWADAVSDLPGSGRVFLELDSDDGAPVDPDGVVSPDLRLCVAAAAEPPARIAASRRKWRTRLSEEARQLLVAEGKGPWHIVRSQPAGLWLLPLIDWVAARLRRPEGFLADRLRAMVEDASLAVIVETPGEALDLFGVIDIVGIDAKGGKGSGRMDPVRWAKAWASAASARADRAVPRGMEPHVHNAIVVLLAATKHRMREGLSAELERDKWIALMPMEKAPDPDYSDLYELAERGDLAEIKRRLRPDGAAWVAALEGIRLLVGTEHGFAVRPEWLARVIEGRAFEELMGEIPAGLGALLLNKDTAEGAVEKLVVDFTSGDFACAERAIGCADAASPETLALLDGVVRAGGRTVSQIPAGLARSLWERAMEFTEEHWSKLPPLPILGVAALDPWHGTTSMGAWFLSMLALSRKAGSTSRPNTALDPWNGIGTEAEMQRFLEALTRSSMASQATHECDEHRALAAIGRELGRDLLDTLGVVRQGNRVIGVQVAHVVVDLASGKELGLSESERHDALQLRCGLSAVSEACAVTEMDLTAVLRWCWQTWAAVKGDNWPPFVWIQTGRERPALVDAQTVWAALPPELVADDMFVQIERWPDVWGSLAHPVWERWFEIWSAKDNRWQLEARVFRVLPEDLAVRALMDGHLDPMCSEIRRILWARMPERMSKAIDDLALDPARTFTGVSEQESPLTNLVWSAPDDQVADLVGRVQRWLVEPVRYVGAGAWVWKWLMTVVEGRKPGWRPAFALLAGHRRASKATAR